MKRTLFKIFDYLYARPRLRTALLWTLILAFVVVIFPLPMQRYMLAIVLLVLIQGISILDAVADIYAPQR